MRHPPQRRSAGFTLVELVVVIFLLTLLLNILVANVGRALAHARDRARIATLVDIQQAIENYHADNLTYPVTDCAGATYHDATGDIQPAWAEFNFRAGDNYAIGTCTTLGGTVNSPSIATTLAPYIKGVSDPLDSLIWSDEGFQYGSNGIDYKVEDVSESLIVPEDMTHVPKSFWDPCNCDHLDANNNCVGAVVGMYCQSQQEISLYTGGAKWW